MNKPILTGLIGFGKAARIFHAPVIRAIRDFKVTAVLERHRQDAKGFFSDARIVRDVSGLLEDRSISLVIITTPNSTHFDYARQSLEAGKHVVVEKPFTLTSRQAQELIRLAEEKKRVITVFQNRRWDGDFLTVRQLIRQNLLGVLAGYESRFDRFRNRPKSGSWKEKKGEGSGLLYDIGPHLIDQSLVLFGPPKYVTADIRIQRQEAEVDDFFELWLDYDRFRVTLGAGMLVRKPAMRFHLTGTRGSFVKYGLDPQEQALIEGGFPDDTGWGNEPEELWGNIDVDLDGIRVCGRAETLPGNYRGFYDNLKDALRGEAKTEVTPEQMLQTIQIIEKAEESQRKQKAIEF